MSVVDAPLHPFIRPVEGSIGERRCFVCGHGFDGNRVTADGVVPGRRVREAVAVHRAASSGVRPSTSDTQHARQVLGGPQSEWTDVQDTPPEGRRR